MNCLNRKTLIGLGVFAVAMFFFAPSGRGALPLILFAACPLTMMWMRLSMSRKKSSGGSCATERLNPQQEIDLKKAEIARLEAMLQDNNRSDRS